MMASVCVCVCVCQCVCVRARARVCVCVCVSNSHTELLIQHVTFDLIYVISQKWTELAECQLVIVVRQCVCVCEGKKDGKGVGKPYKPYCKPYKAGLITLM